MTTIRSLGKNHNKLRQQRSGRSMSLREIKGRHICENCNQEFRGNCTAHLPQNQLVVLSVLACLGLATILYGILLIISLFVR